MNNDLKSSKVTKRYLLIALIFVTLITTSCAVEQSLHRAAFWGDVKMMQNELGKGIDINNIDDNGWTPLYSAVSEGHKDAVIFLLKHGARIDVTDNSGWSIIDEAKFKNQTEIIDILEAEQTRRINRYTASIELFGSLVVSDRTTAVYSQWFKKYPIEVRSYWYDPFRSVDKYVRETEIKYLSSEDFHGTKYGFKPEDVEVVQGNFESDRAYQIRVDQINYELEQRRKNLGKTRRLLIADSLQWILGKFKLENPFYDRNRGIMEFDLVAENADFRHRIGAQLNDAKLAKSIFFNPDKVQLDVIFKIGDKSYQLHNIRVLHQGNVLSSAPIESFVYNLSS